MSEFKIFTPEQVNFIEKVTEFHKAFKHLVNTVPTVPPENVGVLRTSLIHEENSELHCSLYITGHHDESVYNPDMVAVLDALCDLQYVLSGAIISFGLQDVFPSAFMEVHRSNMSKGCKTEEEMNDTRNHYMKMGVATIAEYQEESKLWFVYRKEDKKLLKSIDYSPARLKQLLDSFYTTTDRV